MNNTSKKILVLSAISLFATFGSDCQAQTERNSSSNFLTADDLSDVTIPFSISGEGKRYAPTWGLDQAMINEQFMRKGICHMGKENVGIGRLAFRMTLPLNANGNISGELVTKLQERCRILRLASDSLPIVFTADQEGKLNDEADGTGTDPSYVQNKVCNVENWSKLIDAHVRWVNQYSSLRVAGVSPFNEPDYWTVEEGATAEIHRDVAKNLVENFDAFKDGTIAIVGGNTLNNDNAWEWFSVGSKYYQWGNTHQLAGSFANYASYFQKLAAAGKVGYNDEMHNVGEAMIGLEYGMSVGIWWAFDSRARGEFCQISRHGERLAYGEHRNNWTAACVYRHDDGRVKAFIGSSERQALPTSYQFVSTDHDVYYDGQGPTRHFLMPIPGGTGYQKGQSNAERVIDILWGEDVPRSYIGKGTYRIANKATRTVVGANVEKGNIEMQKMSDDEPTQQWVIGPCPSTVKNIAVGDYSFYDIESASNAMIHINVENFSTFDNANVIAYSLNSVPTSNEQWYLEYAGNGYYYIRNRETSLYLTTASSSIIAGVNVMTCSKYTDTRGDRQLWRILPVDVKYETKAPSAPVLTSAEELPASVKLTWKASPEEDVAGYTILRKDLVTDQWNTIARGVAATEFTDNSCRQGRSYIYKVKALDKAENLSDASNEIEAGPIGQPAMIARWDFEDMTTDETANMMDAVLHGEPFYTTSKAIGTKSLSLSTLRDNYLQLPYEIANTDELTITMWVNWRSSQGTTWERIFDFGNGTEQYMFLTPNAGSGMRFAIKDKGEEQQVNVASALAKNKWKHVAVSISKDKTTIYVDGQEAASSTGITIKPADICPTLNYIGRSQFAADPYFTGYIDDVRIFNYALDEDRINEVMNNTDDGIQPSEKPIQATTTAIYDMKGMRQTAPVKGINIMDGKKLLHNR